MVITTLETIHRLLKAERAEAKEALNRAADERKRHSTKRILQIGPVKRTPRRTRRNRDGSTSCLWRRVQKLRLQRPPKMPPTSGSNLPTMP